MAQKIIYVAEKDLPLFDKAEELGLDNISAFVIEALKKFVDQKEAELSGWQEHTLQINNREEEKTVKFTGKLLASERRFRGQTSEGKDRWTDWAIYLTQGGNIVVYRAHGSAWQGEEEPMTERAIFSALPDYDDSVFDYGDYVPGALLEKASAALGQEKFEFVK